MNKLLHIGYIAVCLFYVCLLFDTVFLARSAYRNINLIPFHTIQAQGWSLNVYGNILMFMPLGLYVSDCLKQMKAWKVIGIIFSTSFAIEILQFIFQRGVSDIDDVPLNMLGGCIGLVMYVILRLLFTSKERVHFAIATLSLCIGIPIAALVAILIIAN